MNLRWMLYDCSDPEWNLTPAQRARLMARMDQLYAKERFRSRRDWILAIGGTVVLLFALLLATVAGGPGFLQILLGFATFGVAMLVGQIPLAWLWRMLTVRLVRQAMCEEGFDVCMSCGFLLRGLGDDIAKCPECGTTFAGTKRVPTHE